MSCHYVVRYHEIKILKLSSGMPTCSLSSPITACLRDFSISLDFNLNVRPLNFTVLMVVFLWFHYTYKLLVLSLRMFLPGIVLRVIGVLVLLFQTFFHWRWSLLIMLLVSWVSYIFGLSLHSLSSKRRYLWLLLIVSFVVLLLVLWRIHMNAYHRKVLLLSVVIFPQILAHSWWWCVCTVR